MVIPRFDHEGDRGYEDTYATKDDVGHFVVRTHGMWFHVPASSYKEPLHRIKNRSVGMYMKFGESLFRFRGILKSDYPFGNTRIDLMRTNVQTSSVQG